MKRVNQRGVSPVVATVLLIGMVVVIALIVFLWFRGLTQESITKFGGQNVQLICDQVQFDASYSGDQLFISNSGNVPIFNFKVELTENGGFETKEISEVTSDWQSTGLNPGAAFSGVLDNVDTSSINSISLIPVLIGNTDNGQKAYTCDRKYGYELTV